MFIDASKQSNKSSCYRTNNKCLIESAYLPNYSSRLVIDNSGNCGGVYYDKYSQLVISDVIKSKILHNFMLLGKSLIKLYMKVKFNHWYNIINRNYRINGNFSRYHPLLPNENVTYIWQFRKGLQLLVPYYIEIYKQHTKRAFHQWKMYLLWLRRFKAHFFDKWKIKAARIKLNRLNARRFLFLTRNISEKFRLWNLWMQWQRLLRAIERLKVWRWVRLLFRAWRTVVDAIKRARRRIKLSALRELERYRRLQQAYFLFLTGKVHQLLDYHCLQRGFNRWWDLLRLRFLLRRVLSRYFRHVIRKAWMIWLQRLPHPPKSLPPPRSIPRPPPAKPRCGHRDCQRVCLRPKPQVPSHIVRKHRSYFYNIPFFEKIKQRQKVPSQQNASPLHSTTEESTGASNEELHTSAQYPEVGVILERSKHRIKSVHHMDDVYLQRHAIRISNTESVLVHLRSSRHGEGVYHGPSKFPLANTNDISIVTERLKEEEKRWSAEHDSRNKSQRNSEEHDTKVSPKRKSPARPPARKTPREAKNLPRNNTDLGGNGTTSARTCNDSKARTKSTDSRHLNSKPLKQNLGRKKAEGITLSETKYRLRSPTKSANIRTAAARRYTKEDRSLINQQQSITSISHSNRISDKSKSPKNAPCRINNATESSNISKSSTRASIDIAAIAAAAPQDSSALIIADDSAATLTASMDIIPGSEILRLQETQKEDCENSKVSKSNGRNSSKEKRSTVPAHVVPNHRKQLNCVAAMSKFDKIKQRMQAIKDLECQFHIDEVERHLIHSGVSVAGDRSLCNQSAQSQNLVAVKLKGKNTLGYEDGIAVSVSFAEIDPINDKSTLDGSTSVHLEDYKVSDVNGEPTKIMGSEKDVIEENFHTNDQDGSIEQVTDISAQDNIKCSHNDNYGSYTEVDRQLSTLRTHGSLLLSAFHEKKNGEGDSASQRSDEAERLNSEHRNTKKGMVFLGREAEDIAHDISAQCNKTKSYEESNAPSQK